MARFFFDIEDNGIEAVDDTGLEIEKLSDVRKHAISCLPEIAKDALPDGPTHMFAVRVRDERAAAIFTASLELRSQWLNGYVEE